MKVFKRKRVNDSLPNVAVLSLVIIHTFFLLTFCWPSSLIHTPLNFFVGSGRKILLILISALYFALQLLVEEKIYRLRFCVALVNGLVFWKTEELSLVNTTCLLSFEQNKDSNSRTGTSLGTMIGALGAFEDSINGKFIFFSLQLHLLRCLSCSAGTNLNYTVTIVCFPKFNSFLY